MLLCLGCLHVQGGGRLEDGWMARLCTVSAMSCAELATGIWTIGDIYGHTVHNTNAYFACSEMSGPPVKVVFEN